MSTVRPNSGPARLNRARYFFRSHTKKFGAASLDSLPALGLQRATMGITDQGDSDLCTAYGEAVSNSYEQGKDMSPEWQAANESQYIGAEIVAGADPMPSMQATEVDGSLPQASAPAGNTLAAMGAQWVCNWLNWPQTLWQIALQYLPGIPYLVDGPFSIFDNCRAALVAAWADNKSVIKVFGPWYESWNEQATVPGSTGVLSNPSSTEQPISSHRYTFIDYVPDPKGGFYLKCHMTQGTSYGAGGIVYFDPETINSVFSSTDYSLLITRSRQGDWDGFVLMLEQVLFFFSQRLQNLSGSIFKHGN